MSSNTNVRDIVMGYQRALGNSDWAAARHYLRDDMIFKGPNGHRHKFVREKRPSVKGEKKRDLCMICGEEDIEHVDI